MIPKGSDKRFLKGPMLDILSTPIEDVPIIEYETHEIELPILPVCHVGAPEKLYGCGNRHADTAWGGVRIDSSFVQYGNLQVDYLIFGVGIHITLDPMTFVAGGIVDGRSAIADFSAPWRAVWEILHGYRVHLMYQQRHLVLDEALSQVAHVAHGAIHGNAFELKSEGDPKPLAGLVGNVPYIERLNARLIGGNQDTFSATSITSTLVNVLERFDMPNRKWCPFKKPILFEQGIPFSLDLVRSTASDWTEHAVIKRPLLANRDREVYIPAGRFQISFYAKGFEIWGDYRGRVYEEARKEDPGLIDFAVSAARAHERAFRSSST